MTVRGSFQVRLGLPVERQVHCDLVTESGNGARQGSEDVGKSSTLENGTHSDAANRTSTWPPQ